MRNSGNRKRNQKRKMKIRNQKDNENRKEREREVDCETLPLGGKPNFFFSSPTAGGCRPRIGEREKKKESGREKK